MTDFQSFRNTVLEDEDLHHKVFNEDYYIIGYYQAEQWLIQERSCCGRSGFVGW